MNKRYNIRANQRDLDLFNKVVADVKPLNLNSKVSHNSIKNSSASGQTNQAISLSLGITGGKKSKGTVERKALNIPLAINEYPSGRVPGLDRKTALRLKKGQFYIDYQLDLHGMSQNVAQDALELCIVTACQRSHRSLLIITGKGLRSDKSKMNTYHSERGVLRRLVPLWLSERPLSEFVLAFSIAQPEHGGSGAFYVLLKRNS
jgi:DNA-nicking Smr family endonuclease